ncbi:MICOS complex subunit MIC10-like [Onthophagus taurus]|uniref:MICOS complex subunit MIC10-like n=1 Tax=Onthophagus taurus TaxID=166361 RepID=UPI000C20DFB1|nr:MICOS complex subunit MIC10-like [Onthophagus taurus]
MASPAYVEDEVGQRFDRCLTDGVLKFGGGAVLGAVFSLLFFKRRRWPIILGGGFGMGMAYSNCESELNELMASRAHVVPKASSKCQ